MASAPCQVCCWDPFTGEQRHFRTCSELESYEEGLHLSAGLYVEPECPACETREDHDVDQQRCMQLQNRRAVQQRAGCYNGPISPFDLPRGRALRTLFPAEYAAHCLGRFPELLWLLSLPAVRLALAKSLRLPEIRALKCVARALRDDVDRLAGTPPCVLGGWRGRHNGADERGGRAAEDAH